MWAGAQILAAPGNIGLADDVLDDGFLVEERHPVHHFVRGCPPEDGLCLTRVQDAIVHLCVRARSACTLSAACWAWKNTV